MPNWMQFLFPIPPIIALFWSMMLFLRKERLNAHRIMAALMLLFVVAYILFLNYFNPKSSYVSGIFYTAVALCVPVLHYMFFRSVTTLEGVRNKDYLFFIPAAIQFIGTWATYLLMGSDEGYRFYHDFICGMGTPRPDESAIWKFSEFFGFYYFRAILTLVAVVMIFLSFKQMNNYHKLLSNHYANTAGRERNIWFVGIGFVCSLLPFIPLMAVPFYEIRDNFGLLIFSLIFVTLSIFFTGFYAYRIRFSAEDLQKNLEKAKETEVKKPNEVKGVRADELNDIYLVITQARLRKLVEEKYCLRPDITITSLAAALRTDHVFLSDVIAKTYNGASFAQFIHNQRAIEAKRLMNDLIRSGEYDAAASRDMRKRILEDVGMQCGYTSLNSFSHYFEEIAGVTPTEYMAGGGTQAQDASKKA